MANKKTNWHTKIEVKLAQIETKLNNLIEQFKNHLIHDWQIKLALVTITGGSLIALILALLKIKGG